MKHGDNTMENTNVCQIFTDMQIKAILQMATEIEIKKIVQYVTYFGSKSNVICARGKQKSYTNNV